MTLVVAVIVQNLAAHYQFLEQHPLRKELTNRYEDVGGLQGKADPPEVPDPATVLGLHVPLMSWRPLCREFKGESLWV